jgi:hypothetical protein
LVWFYKHPTGIAGRKPYGITTRMLEIVGWKRIEVNRLMKFGGVTELNFQSILRRSFVWKPKARFLDAEYLKDNYPNASADGVFAKKPLLKKFLSSGVACAAGLRMQHGFEHLNSPAACRNRIEAYAALGGDGGLTEDSMRMACGLQPRDRSKDALPAAAACLTVQSQPSDAVLERAGFQWHCCSLWEFRWLTVRLLFKLLLFFVIVGSLSNLIIETYFSHFLSQRHFEDCRVLQMQLPINALSKAKSVSLFRCSGIWRCLPLLRLATRQPFGKGCLTPE